MLIILGLILISLIVIVGGDRGVVSLIALVGNLLLLSFAIWLMAAGVPVLFVTVGAGIVISCITLFYQNGTNVKTWSAFISVAITMLVLFFVIYVVIWSTEAGGLNEIQSVGDDILYYNMDLNISMRNVMVSVILLSTLGAILDMALTVTTSVYEVKNHKSEMKFTELVESGMKIGREVIGTTVNTLLFAYLGESLYPVLFEQPKNGKFFGHAPNYMEVLAKGENLHNQLRNVKITAVEGDTLLGEIQED